MDDFRSRLRPLESKSNVPHVVGRCSVCHWNVIQVLGFVLHALFHVERRGLVSIQHLVSVYNIMLELWRKAAMRRIQSIQFNSPKWAKRINSSWVAVRGHEMWGCGWRCVVKSSRDIDSVSGLPYPGWVLLHLVLVAVGTVGMAAPEAALTELIAMTLLAPIPETHHALAPAIRTFHRMEDWGEKGVLISINRVRSLQFFFGGGGLLEDTTAVESRGLTIFNISKSVHEWQPYEALRGRICHQHVQKRVQHDLLLDTNPYIQTRIKKQTNKRVNSYRFSQKKKKNNNNSYLLWEARPHRMLSVAKRWTLKHGCGELQHLPEKLIEFCKHHGAAWVRDLWENIWARANVRLVILRQNTVEGRLLTFIWMCIIDPHWVDSAHS